MDNENKTQQHEVSDVASRLAQSFQELVEASVSGHLKELPDQIVKLSNQVSQVERKQQQSLHNFESIRQFLENTVLANELLEKATETHRVLGTQHYLEHIIEPMVRSLFPVFDVIGDFRKHHVHLDGSTKTLIDSIYTQLQQFCDNYDVEIFEHSKGDRYDPKVMTFSNWEDTSQEPQSNTIAESLRVGFRLGTERILRMETVSLFKYKPSNTITHSILERTF